MAATSRSSAVHKLLEKSPDPVYVLDDERTIVFCNMALRQWTGVASRDIVGRRVDYYSSDAASGPPGVAAGLCPPPAAFVGEEVAGHVTCMSPAGRLLHRRARFVPLGNGPEECIGVVAFVAGADVDARQLTVKPSSDTASDALHVAIRRFHAEQQHRYALERILGESPAIRQARDQIAAAAATSAHVVVIGPPGSGRAHVGRAIHYRTHPKDQARLMPLRGELVDGDSIAAALETAASHDPSEARGTLLLMDADRLNEAAQQALSAGLARHGQRSRVICTCRSRLVELAGAERFRRDLACTLSTLEVHLPPLADRPEDLPLLIEFFLEEANRAGGKQVAGFTADALAMLAGYHWPGNLDELQESIAAAHDAAEGHRIDAADLPSRLHHAAGAAAHPRPPEETIVLDEYLADIETELITRALRRARGNKTQAAKLLGMNRPRFYRRLEQLGLEETDE